MSNLSLEEISQCLCSLISVKSQGLMSAPLQPKEKFKKIVIPITDAPEDLRHFPELISALNLLFHSNKKLQLIQTNFTNFQSGFTERKFHALGLFRDFLILFFIFFPSWTTRAQEWRETQALALQSWFQKLPSAWLDLHLHRTKYPHFLPREEGEARGQRDPWGQVKVS